MHGRSTCSGGGGSGNERTQAAAAFPAFCCDPKFLCSITTINIDHVTFSTYMYLFTPTYKSRKLSADSSESKFCCAKQRRIERPAMLIGSNQQYL